jgi:hypothetical protein
MAAPNIQTSNNPQYVSGGEMGAVVGYSATTTLGFYGDTGIEQATIAAAASDANSAVTLSNSIRTILLDLGLVKA